MPTHSPFVAILDVASRGLQAAKARGLCTPAAAQGCPGIISRLNSSQLPACQENNRAPWMLVIVAVRPLTKRGGSGDRGQRGSPDASQERLER